jgi:hypothetical protein
VSPYATALFQVAQEVIFSPEPESIGYPDAGGMSTHYVGNPAAITRTEIDDVSEFLLTRGVLLQNSRLRKMNSDAKAFEVLIASAEPEPNSITEETAFQLENADSNITITLRNRDHSDALLRVCEFIETALNFMRSEDQDFYLKILLEYFRTGNVEKQKEGKQKEGKQKEGCQSTC